MRTPVDCCLNECARPYIYVRNEASGAVVEGDSFVQLGHRFVSRHADPEGTFAHWSWNGYTLQVENDRYGAMPIFYRGNDQFVIVATTLHQIASRVGRFQLDREAISLFLCFGYFGGTDTPFQEVRCLAPGARLLWRLGAGLKLEERGLPVIAERPWKEDQAVERYRRLFSASIERRPIAKEPLWHLMSGGRDSRHILLELCRQGRKPEKAITVELGNPGNDRRDAAIARTLCQRLNIDHEIVDPSATSFLKAELVKNKLTGFAGEEGAWMVPLMGAVNGKAGVLYDGLGGDALSAGLFLREGFERLVRGGRSEDLEREIMGRNRKGMIDKFRLASELVGETLTLDLAASRFWVLWKAHADRPNPLTSFFFYIRTRRIIAHSSYGLLHGVPFLYAPYLDNELYDFLLSLPQRLLLDKKFHDNTITRSYPGFSDIPYTRTSDVSSLTSGSSNQVRILFSMWRWVLWRCPEQLARVVRWSLGYRVSTRSRSISRSTVLLLLDARSLTECSKRDSGAE